MNAPILTESQHKLVAQRMLHKWGKEMNAGMGAPNILAIFERLGDGDPAFHISPGPMFSPMSQRTDRVLRDLRMLDPKLTNLLIAHALDYSHQSIANATGAHKSRVQDDLREAYGAFSTAVFYLTHMIKYVPQQRARKMTAEDIGL